jgi:hypothetical protein
VHWHDSFITHVNRTGETEKGQILEKKSFSRIHFLNINKKGLKIGGSIGAPHGEGEVAEVQLEDEHTHTSRLHMSMA